MKNIISVTLLMLPLLFVYGCNGNSKDDIAPEIDMSGQGDFPTNCSNVIRGESFTFHATFSDNVELGSFSIDIHNNFNHHTHSTDVTECDLDAVKSPVNPFLFINEYDIPSGNVSYTATVEIEVPETVDPGDYHFMVRVTDKEGWQTYKGISFKLIDYQ